MLRPASVLTLLVLAAASFPSLAPAASVDLLPDDPSANGFCGTAAATGDVNDDGRDDVVLGCIGDDAGLPNGAGAARVFIRNAGNTGFDQVRLTHPDPQQVDGCGSAVATGDVNGDGRDDVVMGCSGDGITDAPNTGSAVVFRRNAGNNGFDGGVVLTAATQDDNDKCGEVAAGDLTGDGLADVVSGCPTTGTLDTGNLHVFQSSAGGSFASTTLAHTAPESFDKCGASVALGDVTGDGRLDLAAGCTSVGPSGGVLLFTHAAGSGMSFDPGVEILPGGGSSCAVSVAVGDVDGNGTADLAMGCYQTTPPGSVFSGATAMLVRNAANTGFDATTWLYPPTPVAAASCGTDVAVAEAGGDAHKDVVMGCSGDDIGGVDEAGSAVVFLRATSNTGFGAGTPLTHGTPAVADHCGRSVAVGDTDGNQGGDIVMGCEQRDTGATSSGGAVLFFGTPPSPLAPIVPVAPTQPPAPAPPAPAPAPSSETTDKSPTSVSASVSTVTAVPVDASGAYSSPAVTCGESRCIVVMDSRTTPPATTSGRRAASKPKTVSIGGTRFTVKGGAKRSVKIKLNARGKALLRKRRSMKITIAVKVTDDSGNVRRFTPRMTLKRGKLK